MSKSSLAPLQKTSFLHLSVEEENLASIPFAILERRVGKRVGRIEIKGTKVLPNGGEVAVSWQVQGNSELGLPTEQDLDIFVALGVLTFQNNFAKTVSFSGREIAKILNINSVHGKFYQRLKLAMDRFIPLRFRAITETDHQEDVKWLNVFQEASFTLDRASGRCTGSVTWTDKLIRSMDSGFFRMLNASHYMELDGITAKHLYRFLAVAFETTDVVIMDARKLATQHLGILTPPKYFSRLMQTIEPALDQLISIQVLGSYHVVSAEKWEIAMHHHPTHVPERKALLHGDVVGSAELHRAACQKQLEKAGMPSKVASSYGATAETRMEFFALERAARVLEAMIDEDVLPHVAVSLVKRALDAGASHGEGREVLDWCEIAIETCRDKKKAGQNLRNRAGLLIRIAKDPEARERLVSEDIELRAKKRFRQCEEAVVRQENEAEQRTLVIEYERFRQKLVQKLFDEMFESKRQSLRRAQIEILRQQERFERMPQQVQEQEIDALILQDLARTEAPPYDRWLLRNQVRQAVLPFAPTPETADLC
jgi:hypothetical protein